ncbi:MAG: hypothetical protein K2N51_00060 [Lachnospiraceae bacterium]|nr:hypothetical protein [Lachnospiraceae bacterium]
MNKNKIQKWLLAMSAFAVMLICVGTVYTIVHAESISITEIDYEKLTLTVKANAGDSRIFLATTKNATKWDEIPGELDTNNQVTMDISWVSNSKNYTLYLKGDKSTEPISVTLPKQNTKFKATLSKDKISFTNAGTSGKYYWRKSTSTEWKEFDPDDQSEMQNLLESFSLKGISLVFRTGQVVGTSAGKPGERPSKISTLKIAKRAAAPNVSLNYNTMTFAVKKTMEYKLSTEDTWKDINTTTLNLGDVMSSVLYDQNGKNMKEDETVGIDFRVKATASKVASQTKTLQIPRQEDTPTGNITTAYTGPTQLKLLIEKKDVKIDEKEVTLEAASSSNPYEYTVVKSGETLDIYKAKWTGITTETTKISSTVAPEKSSIYVRKKATATKLPGMEHKIVESVHYVDASSLGKEQYNLKKIQGVDNELQFAILVGSEEAEVSSITFNGTKAGFKAAKPQKIEGSDNYLITVTINDTAAIENVSENLGKEMTAEITLSNTEVIKKGVTLYIQKAASIEAKSYTTYEGYGFIGGNGDNGALTFDIALNKEKAEELTEAKVVDNIAYNGKIIESSQYKVEESKEGNKITITIPQNNVAALGANGAGYVTRNKYGTAYSLVVTLKNKEKLDNIKLTVDYPVKVSSSSKFFGISKKSYETFIAEKKAAEDANKNNTSGNTVSVPTTYSNPEITYTIQSEICKEDGDYHVTGLTWNGNDVFAAGDAKDGTITVTVSLDKLVTLSTGSASLDVTLENATGKTITVDYGYQITLTD